MSEESQTIPFSEDGFSRVAAMKILFLAAVFLFLLILLHRFFVRDPAAPTSGGPRQG